MAEAERQRCGRTVVKSCFVKFAVFLCEEDIGPPCQVHGLSFYEFHRHYRMNMASHPWTLKKHQEHLQNPDQYETKLTDAGVKKVTEGAKTRGAKPKMVAGVDYQIQEEGGEGWKPFGQGPLVKHHRHDWVMELRPRPHVPVIYGAQGSQSDQEQAMRLLVLFFPWVNCAEDATTEAPFIGDFWQKGMQDWRQALRAQVTRLGGFPTEEVKRYMLDFSFVYFLPRSLALEDGLAPNSDNKQSFLFLTHQTQMRSLLPLFCASVPTLLFAVVKENSQCAEAFAYIRFLCSSLLLERPGM